TTVREMGSMNGLSWMIDQKQRAEANTIAAPRLLAYAYFPAVNDMVKTIYTPEQGRSWLRAVKERGADGIKFFGAPPAIMEAEPGSAKWNEVLEQFLEIGFTFVPTFTIYDANRDLMRARQAYWHKEYTWKSMWDYFTPQRGGHGSYWYRWSTQNEIEWKQNYR